MYAVPSPQGLLQCLTRAAPRAADTLTAEGYEELWRSEGGSMRRPGYEEQVVTAEVLGAVRVQAVTLRAAPLFVGVTPRPHRSVWRRPLCGRTWGSR